MIDEINSSINDELNITHGDLVQEKKTDIKELPQESTPTPNPDVGHNNQPISHVPKKATSLKQKLFSNSKKSNKGLDKPVIQKNNLQSHINNAILHQSQRNSIQQQQPVSLQNVNLIQFNQMAQPMHWNNSLGLLAECLAKSREQQQKQIAQAQNRKQALQQVPVFSQSEKWKKYRQSMNLPQSLPYTPQNNTFNHTSPSSRSRTGVELNDNNLVFRRAFFEILKVLGVNGGVSISSTPEKIRLFLSLLSTLQFGSPKIRGEGLITNRKARSQFIIYLCLRFTGMDIVPLDFSTFLTSESLQDMNICLYVFMILFERFCMMNLGINASITPTKISKNDLYDILHNIGGLKNMFVEPNSLTAQGFVELFKLNYSKVWDKMVSVCGETSVFITTINNLSRIAFKLIKTSFMLQIFREGTNQEMMPLHIPQNILLSKVMKGDHLAIYEIVPHLRPLSTFLVENLLKSIIYAGFKYPVVLAKPRPWLGAGNLPFPTDKTDNVINLVGSDERAHFDRHPLKISRKRKLPEIPVAPKNESKLTSPVASKNSVVKKKKTKSPKKSSTKTSKPSPVKIPKEVKDASTNTEIPINPKEAILPKYPSKVPLWLEDKVEKMDTVVQNLNIKLDKLLSTAKYCLEQIEK